MSIPKWRYVRYTDDGCSAYQCLNCYNGWEARTEPAWFDTTKRVPGPCEGSMSYTDGPTGERIHFVRRDDPIFKPVWTFCPYCGVRWEGPVVMDPFNENEYMYGTERAAKHKLVYERRSKDGWRHPEYLRLWWVIVERSVWRSDTAQAGNVGSWEPKEYARVDLMPAAKMLYLLKDHQARLDAEYNNDPHSYCTYEAKIVVTFVQPKDGYEIRNYDWERNEPDYAKPKADRAAGA